MGGGITGVLSSADALISQQNWNDARLKLQKLGYDFRRATHFGTFDARSGRDQTDRITAAREKVLADLRQVRSRGRRTTKRKRLSVLLDATQRIAQLDYADDQIRTEAAAIVALLQAKISEQERRPKPQEPAPKAPALPTRIERPEGQFGRSAGFRSLRCCRSRPCPSCNRALVHVDPKSDVSVAISGTPDEVSIAVNGMSCITPDCKLRLRPGTYTIEAKKDGLRLEVNSAYYREG